jgi:opacity protein-like surface antigen
MKTKLYVLVAGFILLSTTTWAQKFGLKAGINLSNEKASAAGVSVRASSKVGFTVGAFADWEITNAFSIQSELNYSQMGAKVGSQKETLDYIAIPVLA